MHAITELPDESSVCSPKFLNHPAYRCLRVGDIGGFHRYRSEEDVVDLTNADLRGIDLRKADLRNVVLRGAYLKDADLRGQDLRHHDLEGCSLRNAKIGGVFFPENIRPEEVIMSVQHGTRIRVT